MRARGIATRPGRDALAKGRFPLGGLRSHPLDRRGVLLPWHPRGPRVARLGRRRGRVDERKRVAVRPGPVLRQAQGGRIRGGLLRSGLVPREAGGERPARALGARLRLTGTGGLPLSGDSSVSSSPTISPVAVLTATEGADCARVAATARAVLRPMPGTSQICSTVAARSLRTEPKCLTRACLRVSPRPGTSSRGLVRMRLERLARW